LTKPAQNSKLTLQTTVKLFLALYFQGFFNVFVCDIINKNKNGEK